MNLSEYHQQIFTLGVKFFEDNKVKSLQILI